MGEKEGKPITRSEAIKIAKQIAIDAEAKREEDREAEYKAFGEFFGCET